MATAVIMPKNGMAMEEGKLIKWLKNVGDRVEKDDPLIEIETDKITMEEPAAVSGVLLAQLAKDGETIPVLETIGWIGEAGEQIPESPKAAGAPAAEAPSNVLGMLPPEPAVPAAVNTSAVAAAPVVAAIPAGGAVPATPYAKALAAEAGISITAVPATGKVGEVTAADVLAVKATPLAARIAADTGVDLSTVAGSGYGGKIRAEDLPQSAPVAAGGTRKPMSAMRKAVARGMAAAHAQIPCVTENLRADVTALMRLRAEINENREQKLSINDFILKAVARALAAHPEMLVSLDGEDMILHDAVHLGMAVALDEGLIVPVIRDANRLGLEAMAAEARNLAEKARAGRLLPDEYAGSTFTISNMGAFGIESFTPIINLPNAAILGVCAITDELALVGGEVVVQKKMGLSLTFDHRLLDGVPPAKFLLTLKRMLENPLEILL